MSLRLWWDWPAGSCHGAPRPAAGPLRPAGTLQSPSPLEACGVPVRVPGPWPRPRPREVSQAEPGAASQGRVINEQIAGGRAGEARSAAPGGHLLRPAGVGDTVRTPWTSGTGPAARRRPGWGPPRWGAGPTVPAQRRPPRPARCASTRGPRLSLAVTCPERSAPAGTQADSPTLSAGA